jgi:hypothetical protein
MTLVIVEAKAVAPLLWTFLDVETLDQAVTSLADREGVPRPHVIGRWPNQTTVRYLYEEAMVSGRKPRISMGLCGPRSPPACDQRVVLRPICKK